MAKINIIEFTDQSISMPKTPYQVNDWEVVSYKNEPTNLWKYFNNNDLKDLITDDEYLLLSDLALGKNDIEKILKEEPTELLLTKKINLSIFGRIISKIGQLIFSGQVKPYLIRNHCVFILKNTTVKDKQRLQNLKVEQIDSFENQIKNSSVRQIKNTWYLIKYFNPGFAQLILFGIVGIIGMGFDLSIVTILRETFKIDTRICSLISFPFAVSSNYLLNRKFTFKDTQGNIFIGYLKFFAVNIFGLLTRVWAIHYTLFFFPFLENKFYLFITMFGILVAFFINFIMSKLFVFKN